jgi:hypothetical protein
MYVKIISRERERTRRRKASDVRVAALTRLLSGEREREDMGYLLVLFALYTYSVVVVVECIDSSQPSGKQVIHLITTTTNHHLLFFFFFFFFFSKGVRFFFFSFLGRPFFFFLLDGTVHYIWKDEAVYIKREKRDRIKEGRTPYSRLWLLECFKFKINVYLKKKKFQTTICTTFQYNSVIWR